MTAVGYGGGCRRYACGHLYVYAHVCDGIVDNAIEFDEMEEPPVKLARPAREEAARCSWLDPLLVERVTASYLEVLD